MKYEIKLGREFLYYLKIQMIVVNSKIIHFQQRSDMMLRQFQTKKTWLQRTIEVINGFLLVNSVLLKKEKLSEAAGQTISYFAILIRRFLDDETAISPFNTFQKAIKNDLGSLLAKCKVVDAKAPETCLYCGEEIAIDKLTCEENHEVSRCAITKLQIPLSVNNTCSECESCFTNLESLKEITGKDEHHCPYCDRLIIFK